MNPFACKKPFAFFPIVVGVVVALMSAGSSHAAEAAEAAAPQANRFAATIAPAERFEVDGVLVEQFGPKPPADSTSAAIRPAGPPPTTMARRGDSGLAFMGRHCRRSGCSKIYVKEP